LPGLSHSPRGFPLPTLEFPPEFTARLSEPPACSAFDLRRNAPDSVSVARRWRFSAIRRVNATKHILSGLRSRRSRKLGTAFCSPVTTLAPPLRGQCSRPAPSIPRTKSRAGPFDLRLSTRFGFDAHWVFPRTAQELAFQMKFSFRSRCLNHSLDIHSLTSSLLQASCLFLPLALRPLDSIDTTIRTRQNSNLSFDT